MSESVKQLNDLTAAGSSADYGPSSLSRAAAMLDSSSESSSDDESLQEAEQTAARVSTGPVSSSGALSLAAAREAMISSSSDSETDDSDSDDGAKTEGTTDQPASRPEPQSFQPQSGPTSSIGLSMEKANAALLESSDSEETSESDESEAEEKFKAKEVNESNNDLKIEDLELSLSEDPKDFQEKEIEQVTPFEVSVPVHNSTEVQIDNIPDNPVEPATKMIPVENVDSESETETYASSVQNENVEVTENKSEEVQIKDDPLLPDNKTVFAPAVNAVKSPTDPVNHVSSDKELSGEKKNDEVEESETSHWSETSEGEQEEASELNHLESRDDALTNGNQTGAFANEVLKELEHRTSGNQLELTENGTDDEIPLKSCNVGQHVTVYGSKYFFKYGPVYI